MKAAYLLAFLMLTGVASALPPSIPTQVYGKVIFANGTGAILNVQIKWADVDAIQHTKTLRADGSYFTAGDVTAAPGTTIFISAGNLKATVAADPGRQVHAPDLVIQGKIALPKIDFISPLTQAIESFLAKMHMPARVQQARASQPPSQSPSIRLNLNSSAISLPRPRASHLALAFGFAIICLSAIIVKSGKKELELKDLAKAVDKIQVQQFMNSQLAMVEPGTSIKEMIDLLAGDDRNLLVMGGKDILGIITKRSLLKEALTDRKASAVMSSQYSICKPADSLKVLTSALRKSQLAVVMRNGTAVGTVDNHDLIKAFNSDRFIIDSPPLLSRAMGQKLDYVPLKATLAELLSPREGCAIVKDNDKPVGIITDQDLIIALSQDADLNKTYAAHIMSSPIVTLSLGTAIPEVFPLILERGYSQIPLTDDGKIVGIAYLREIVSAYYEFLRNQ